VDNIWAAGYVDPKGTSHTKGRGPQGTEKEGDRESSPGRKRAKIGGRKLLMNLEEKKRLFLFES